MATHWMSEGGALELLLLPGPTAAQVLPLSRPLSLCRHLSRHLSLAPKAAQVLALSLTLTAAQLGQPKPTPKPENEPDLSLSLAPTLSLSLSLSLSLNLSLTLPRCYSSWASSRALQPCPHYGLKATHQSHSNLQ